MPFNLVHVISANELTFAGKSYRCAIGAGGFTDKKREGDKCTPVGEFALRECWYRADRMNKPGTGLPLKPIQEDDGWCDDPTQYYYNQPIKLPSCVSHENLFLEEHSYDVIIPIGYNDGPITPGAGSAIFFHIALRDYPPTLGCVAVSQSDMLEILAALDTHSRILIEPKDD